MPITAVYITHWHIKEGSVKREKAQLAFKRLERRREKDNEEIKRKIY